MIPVYPIQEIQQIKDLLIGRKKTIAVAESVTAGINFLRKFSGFASLASLLGDILIGF